MNMSSSSQNEYALWWQAFSIYSLVIAKVELVLMGLSLGNVINIFMFTNKFDWVP